jgi:hypothetical protein
MEGLAGNPYFKRNNQEYCHESEVNLIKALKLFLKYNSGAFLLMESLWMSVGRAEYLTLSSMAGNGLDIFPEIKNLIWKINRLWVCRLCKKYGAVEWDWRIITVEKAKYLPRDEYNEIREWEKLFESIKSNYSRKELCKIIGCETRAGLFDSLVCLACHEPIKKEIEKIAGMNVFERIENEKKENNRRGM